MIIVAADLAEALNIGDTVSLLSGQIGVLHVPDGILLPGCRRRDGRRGGLYAGQSVVPTFLWIVLLIGAVAVSALALLLTTPRDPKFVHAVMAAGLAVMLVAGLSTIQYLSDPFAGTGAIKPREMQRTIALMESAKSPAIDLSTLRCDAAGARPTG